MQIGSNPSFTKRLMPLALVAALVAAGSSETVQGQTTPGSNSPTTLPKFEVVSIRVAEPGCPSGSGLMPSGDGLRIKCMPLNLIIKISYGLITDDLISGEPGWTKSTFFDITAKIDPADASTFSKFKLHEFGLMLQPVLADRFHLQTHYESKERTLYDLVVAKGGPKLKESPPDPTGKNVPMMTMAKGGELECHRCKIHSMPMFLSHLVGGTVVDQTGLTGTYDFTLSFAPDSTRADDNRPSIITAVQEELGLKFVPKKQPVNVLVIDHVEQPSPN